MNVMYKDLKIVLNGIIDLNITVVLDTICHKVLSNDVGSSKR